MSILLKLFYKVETEVTFLDSFYEATITPIPKLYKDQENELQTNILYEHRCKKKSIKYLQTKSKNISK